MGSHNLSGPAKGGLGAGAAAAVTEVTVGLDRAAQAAGDTLRGIFGGLPWEMAADAITNAVGGGGGGASAEAAGQLTLALGVLV